MDMSAIAAKLKDIINSLNSKGVPIPMVRVDGKPSITGTMAFLSFNNALVGQLGKVAGFLGGVDLTQANYLFGICLAAYLGRRLQADPARKSIEIDKEGSNGQS